MRWLAEHGETHLTRELMSVLVDQVKLANGAKRAAYDGDPEES